MGMTIKSGLFSLLICIAAGLAVTVKGQSNHLTSTNLALGGGGTAYIDGYHANFVNPANLLLGEGEKPRFMIGIIGGLSLNSGGSLANINVYNKYFTSGLTISGSVAKEALDQWFGTNPSSSRQLGLQTDFIPIGLSYRSDKWAASLALRSRVLVNTSVSKGLTQLAVLGFDREAFSNGTPVNFSGETLSFYEVSAGFSHQILHLDDFLGFAHNVKVYAGIAPKLLLGTQASRVDFNSVLTLKGTGENNIDEIRHTFNYSLETTGELSQQLQNFYEARQSQQQTPDIGDYVDPPASDFYKVKSTGVGLDIGGTAEMDLNVPFIGAITKGPEHLKVGIALTDIGKVSFKDKSARFGTTDSLIWNGFTFDQQKIDNKFNGSQQDYVNSVLQDTIATEIYGSYAPQNNSEVGQTLPTLLSLGGQLTLNKLSFSLDLTKGFNYRGVNSKRMALSAGLEYDLLGFLPLRVGLRTGGYSSTSYSAGFGIEFKHFELSVAASTVNNSRNYGSSAAAAWSGLVLRF